MEQSRKLAPDTGNGDGNLSILASEKQPTAGKLKPSRQSTSIAANNTKPVSLRESLSLLQTICYDLQSQGCQVSILARNNRFYVVGSIPLDTGSLEIIKGHISINGMPVSEG